MAGFLHGRKEKRAPLMRVWDGVTIWSFLNAMDFGNHRLFRPDATGYPAVLRRCTDGGHPPVVTAQGSLGVLAGTLIGFFCSVRCPGDIILKTYDLARALRRADAGIIGGFQVAIEKEFLDILLRGTASVVICPARGLSRLRMPKSWRDPLTIGTHAHPVLFRGPYPSPNRGHRGPSQCVCRHTSRPHPHRPCRAGQQNRGAMQGRARRGQAGIRSGLSGQRPPRRTRRHPHPG